MNKVAVLIPAYNEELTIKEVILDFYNYLYSHEYDYTIYVIDNNSSDKTNMFAKEVINTHKINGEVIFVKRQGKANAIREAFRKIDADVYVMIDADCTYWAEDLEKFIKPVFCDDVDMVIGDRISTGAYSKENKRGLHQFGNSLVKKLVNIIFNSELSDIMTGYRAFSKRLVKSYSILCEGFELETDLSIFCLEHKFNLLEVPIKFTDRPQDSFSKLNTFSDGFKVIVTILNLFRNYKPMMFFGIISSIFMLLGLVCGTFPVIEYLTVGYIKRVPLAMLATGLVLSSLTCFSIALILDSARRYQNINFELHVLRSE